MAMKSLGALTVTFFELKPRLECAALGAFFAVTNVLRDFSSPSLETVKTESRSKAAFR